MLVMEKLSGVISEEATVCISAARASVPPGEAREGLAFLKLMSLLRFLDGKIQYQGPTPLQVLLAVGEALSWFHCSHLRGFLTTPGPVPRRETKQSS